MGAPSIYAVVCIPLGLVAAAVALLKVAPLPFFWIWALLTLTILGLTAWLRPMRARGVPLVLIGDVLDIDDPKYRIHAHDTHPSAAANERIADYLAPRLACIPACGSGIR